MGQLVKLNVAFRGTTNEGLAEYGFDVEDIVNPIRFDGTYSYFDARMLKGTIVAHNNLAKIAYKVDHSLSSVASLSDMFVLLTVNKRRNVVYDTTEQMIFVTSKISENIKPDGTGSMFFYAEDGDPLPVEYHVDETIDEILTQATNHQLPTIVELTWVELRALRNTNTLVSGVFYKITDRADAGLIIQATGINQLTLNGTGLFLNPDFQDVGNYSGLTTPKGNNKGVWFLAGQSGGGAYVNDDIVFWDGLMYQVIDDSMFDTNPPDSNTSAYLELTKSITNGYILECDTIMYNFDDDIIFERKDKRGNFIKNCNSGFFQWGNDAVSDNNDLLGTLSCLNQRGGLVSNKVETSNTITVSNEFIDILQSNYFGGADVTFNNTTAANIYNCVFNNASSITLTTTTQFAGKEISIKHSTFNADLDLSDAAIYAANKITIPTSLNYIGEFTLNNNNGKTFNKISNLSTVHKVTRFYVQVGNNQSFQHTTVATATADLLNSDGATTNTIFGRADGNDFIEYEKSGNRNVRVNIVKLV